MDLPLIAVPEIAALDAGTLQRLWFGDAAALSPLGLDSMSFFHWCQMLAREALWMGRLPAWQGALPEEWQAFWPAGIRKWPEDSPVIAADYPFNQLFPHPLSCLINPPPIS